jgi:polyisoprenoid-binding protein YceI
MTEPAGLIASGTATGRWVLDPAGSRADFYVRHFWGAITVHGWFDRMTGSGTVDPDGALTGSIAIAADSLDSGNGQRDRHLRSADFFDATDHPEVIVTLTSATPTAQGALSCTGTLEAAGRVQPIEFTAQAQISEDAVVLSGEITVDRSVFGMTWRPMRVASLAARATVTARFVRG